MLDRVGEWLSIGRTQIPAPPPSTKITVRELTPDRFDVTFPVEALAVTAGISFLLWALLMLPLMIGAVILAALIPQIPILIWMGAAFFVPLWIANAIGRAFRRPHGGRLCLERSQLSAEGGSLIRWSRVYPLGATSKFAVVMESSEDSSNWVLTLGGAANDITLADDRSLTVADLRWIGDRLNEWLGWEFPSHCIACGRHLEVRDLNWPERRVVCSGCGFRGPAPQELDEQWIPSAPPDCCPNCAEPTWLTQVNRTTGGCRCFACGWESEAAPPFRRRDFADFASFGSEFMGRYLSLALQFPQHLVTDDELMREFPSKESAWSRLTAENLLDRQETERSPSVSYTHWQTRGLKSVTAALAFGIALTIALPATVLRPPAQDKSWPRWLVVGACRIGTLAMSPAVLGILWWGRRKTVLVFSPQALAWSCARRCRVATWSTVGRAAVPRGGWPPLLLLMHGGATLMFCPPTKTAARALARLCIAHRGEAGAGVFIK